MLQSLLSPDFFNAILRATTPILFAALASSVASKSGITNMALEGIMLFSALFGVIFSAMTGNFAAGLLLTMAAGGAIGLLLAFFVLNLKTDEILAAIAINLMATGGTTFALYMITGAKGTTFSYLASLAVPTIQIPIIKDIPLLGPILSGHSLLTYLAFLCTALIWWLLFKTRLGLRLRSVGENPHAAESVGISVTRIRTTAYIIAGAVAGLGGAFMSMSYVAWFSRDMVAGRGFIGLSANNIANGSPVVATIFSMLFGMADTVANILQLTDAGIAYFVKMLPYVITIVGMVVMSVFQIRRRKHMKQKAVAAAIQEAAAEKQT